MHRDQLKFTVTWHKNSLLSHGLKERRKHHRQRDIDTLKTLQDFFNAEWFVIYLVDVQIHAQKTPYRRSAQKNRWMRAKALR